MSSSPAYTLAQPSRRRTNFSHALVAVLALMLGACSSLPQNVSRTPSQALDPGVESTLATNLQPLFDANPGLSGFYTLGESEAAFAARVQLIAAAQRTLDIQYYIWHDDLTGRAIHTFLQRAADRGVRVRLLLDDLDTTGKDELLRLIDHHPNIEIRVFNPFANRDSRVGDFIADTRRVNRRMHNKTLTADNVATIFGGRNIGDEYFGAEEEVAFGDMDALGVGGIAQDVSRQFDLYWNSKYAYPIDAFDWDEAITEEDATDYRKVSEANLQSARNSQYAQVLKEVKLAQVEQISDVVFVWSDWKLIYDLPETIESSKVSHETHMAPQLARSVSRAKEDLVIISPYFVPGDAVTAELVALVEKGTRVRILTNSLQANDVSLVHAGYMRYRKDLIQGGVELYEYKSDSNKVRRKLKRQRIDVEKTSLHAKFIGFDKEYLFIGSFNLDGRSARLNTELGGYFRSPSQATALTAVFDSNILDFAYRVELNDAGKLEWVTRGETGDVRVNHEPDTSWWKRFSTSFLSYIVPEGQL